MLKVGGAVPQAAPVDSSPAVTLPGGGVHPVFAELESAAHLAEFFFNG